MNSSLEGAGKRWRLRRLADSEGGFAMVAIDQRPPIFAALARARGVSADDVPFADVVAAKRLLGAAFASQASALLVDPNWGYPGVADVLDPSRGLLLTLEDHRTTPDRRSSCIADWSVDKIRALGGDAVKLLAWYHPRAAPAVREHQQAFVQRVGEDCARCDLPFVLELLLYPLHEDDADAYREDSAKRIDEVVQSVETFAAPRYRVDLFKLESPLPAPQVPSAGHAGADACARAFAQLDAACGQRPWVMLSAGASADDFERVLGYAADAGAAGFLAGRALWADALALWPDPQAMRAHLTEVGLPRLRRWRALMQSRGRAWQPEPWMPAVDGEGQFARAR